jgi:hypothetical protein
MRSSLLRRLACSIFIFGAFVSARANAGDAALAEQLFREGRERLDAGDYANACPKLEESYTQDPATGTLLALALCQEATGKTASAWANYGEVAARSKREGRADREQAASEHQSALEPTLSYLTIHVDDATRSVPGVVITRDGEPVGAPAWNSAFPIDPGVHHITVTAPGKQSWEGAVTVADKSDRQVVDIPVLVDTATSAPIPPPPPAPAATDAEPSPQAGSSKLRWIGVAVGGAGVVGLGVATYFGVHATQLNESSKENGHCNAQNQCDTTGGTRRDDALKSATVSTAMFITGGVLLATGVTLFVLGERSHSDARGAAAELRVGAGSATVLGRF